MNGMTYCDMCEMQREFCEHGLVEKRRNAATRWWIVDLAERHRPLLGLPS
jgi:hypothetical protein